MQFDIRSANEDEMDQLGLMGAYSYAGAFGDGVNNIVRNSQRPEWTLCAFDGPTMATSYAAFPFTIRANGNTLSYAGITAVGTRPEYRRQGLLRKIMTQAFVQQREKGQAVAGLWASQAAIYQRYGFSTLGANRRYVIDTVDIGFCNPNDVQLKVERYAAVDALPIVKNIYREFAADRFGYLHRAQPMWADTVLAADDNSGPIWVAVVYGQDNSPAGYVVYSLRADKLTHASRSQEIIIRDLAWLDITAYENIWTFIARHDLVGRVVWPNAPIDDPMLALIQEPRMLHHQDTEGSWFRIVDMPAALSQRGYRSTGTVIIDIETDTIAPWNVGRWEIEFDGLEATAKPTSKDWDIALSATAMGALFSGSQRATDLYHWGLLRCAKNNLQDIDAIFATAYAPHCPDHY